MCNEDVEECLEIFERQNQDYDIVEKILETFGS